MVFCNLNGMNGNTPLKGVTILILIDGFLQSEKNCYSDKFLTVTILILIDGFLQ